MVQVEREARARFWVFRVNRWSVALVLLIVLALLLWPSGRYFPVLSTGTVNPGVTMLGRDFSGMTEAEAREALQQMAPAIAGEPVAARVSQSGGVSYVIPDLSGYALDVDRTLSALSQARANTRVPPVTRLQPAPKRLGDYPQSVIRQGNPTRRTIGLFINVDVGWGKVEIPAMLKVFREHGVKVTFFVSGRWAAQNAAVLKEIVTDGHEVATHGHDLSAGPKDLSQAGKLREDLARSVATIETVTGTKVLYYAPHMSEVSAEIVKTAADLNLRTVLYSLDTVDWRASTTEAMVLATLQRAKAGDLILMHPKPTTAAVLDKALRAYAEKGLKPVTLTEMLSPDPESPSATLGDTH